MFMTDFTSVNMFLNIKITLNLPSFVEAKTQNNNFKSLVAAHHKLGAPNTTTNPQSDTKTQKIKKMGEK